VRLEICAVPQEQQIDKIEHTELPAFRFAASSRSASPYKWNVLTLSNSTGFSPSSVVSLSLKDPPRHRIAKGSQ
jgi:hypothetical protein